jgi:hypothetical protein
VSKPCTRITRRQRTPTYLRNVRRRAPPVRVCDEQSQISWSGFHTRRPGFHTRRFISKHNSSISSPRRPPASSPARQPASPPATQPHFAPKIQIKNHNLLPGISHPLPGISHPPLHKQTQFPQFTSPPHHFAYARHISVPEISLLRAECLPAPNRPPRRLATTAIPTARALLPLRRRRRRRHRR